MRTVLQFCSAIAVVGLAALAQSGCASKPADEATTPVRIVRVWSTYRDAGSFARFGEFPEKDEEPGHAVVLRSQPEERAGYYFTIRLTAAAGSKSVPDGRLVLHVVPPGIAQSRSFAFPFTAGGKRSVLLLAGLTGSDWTYGDTMPAAWKVEVFDTAGQLVASHQSFLWAQP